MLLILYTIRVRTWGRCTSSGKRSRPQHRTVQGRPTWWLERSPEVQYTAVISRSAHLFRGLSQTLTPQWLLLVSAANTKSQTPRKLSYRKDDRAMRLIHGCPENFRQFLSTPKATLTIAVLGWGCEPPILGKRRPQRVGDGTVRESVGEFL